MTTELSCSFQMLINGQMTPAAKSIGVINPATGQEFARAPDCTEAQLDAAVASAASAFPAWRDLPIAERQSCVRKAGELIAENVESLTRLFTNEQGRPLAAARDEILGAAGWLNAVSAMSPPVGVIVDNEELRVELHQEALGVVCAIAPWNFPVTLAIWKIAPALVVGNTIVLKPSPFTPLCTLRIGEILKDVFPAGVLNVVSGGDALGPMMTSHDGFAKISFTGSTQTGSRVMAAAAKGLKRITLELGGNDAAIVLPDVDLDEVAIKLFFAGFFNSAQICVAAKRLYIHNDIYDDLRDRLASLAQTIKVGAGDDPESVLGPVQNKLQFDRVNHMLDRARSAGYRLIQGSVPRNSGGYFIPVTLVDNPPHDSDIVQQEAFGPILPLIRFSTVDEVIKLANESIYGLAGSIWTKDITTARSIASRLDTGTVWINQIFNFRPDTPFAGRKQSGIGVENGVEGMLEFCTPKTIFIPKQ